MANKRKAELMAKIAPPQMTDQERRRKRFAGGIATRALQHYEEKYGKNPALAQALAASKFNKDKVLSE
jgi:hypothetical protein